MALGRKDDAMAILSKERNLIELYNVASPNEAPAVKTYSPERLAALANSDFEREYGFTQAIPPEEIESALDEPARRVQVVCWQQTP